MKRSFCLLLVALVLALGMTACGGSEHVHTYASTLVSDELMHWYPTTCDETKDCKDVRAYVGYHEDKNNDGACDICGYGRDHKHSYEAAWSVDAENHWHAVDCGHAVEVNGKGAHVDENNDSVCDVCAYDYNHTHTHSTDKWTTDAEAHWHAVTCGHAIEVLDRAPHTDADKDGACDVCAYADAEHTHTPTDAWVTDATSHWHTCTEHVGYITDAEAHSGMEGDGVCDVCSYSDATHTHSYASVWSVGETTHWHASSCGHADLKKDEAAHLDENNDGACDVCAYTGGHTHTYTDAWSSDAEGHWHASDCDHDVTVAYGAHTDENNDGACDVCAYNGGHTHTYSDAWTSDANGHWHAPSCGHSIANSDYAAHTDENGDAKCDVCSYEDKTCAHASNDWYFDGESHWQYCDKHPGYVMKGAHEHGENGVCICGHANSLDGVIGTLASGNAAGGSIEINGKLHAFGFGENLLHVWTVGGDEYWYELLNAGTEEELPFGIKLTANGLVSADCTADSVTGYAFSLSDFLGNSVYKTVYGVENLIAYLYEGAKANQNKDAILFDNGNSYGFYFGYCGSSYSDFVVLFVEFTVDGDGTVTYATITAESYYAYASPRLYTYENGVATLNEGAKPTSTKTWVIKQTAGEKNAVNPYSYDSLFPSSFDLVDADGNVIENGGTYTTQLGKNPTLMFDNVLPGTASIGMDKMTYTVTDANGKSVSTFYPYVSGSLANGFMLYSGYGVVPGTYTVTLRLTNCEFTFTVIAEGAELTSFKGQYYDETLSYPYYKDITATTAYSISTAGYLKVKAAVNSYADPACTVSVTSGDASAISLKPLGNGEYELRASAAGTYTVALVSSVNPEMASNPITLTVTAAMSAADAMPGGKYMYIDTYNSKIYTVTVTPDAEGATTGTLVYDVNGTAETYTYSVAEDLTVTLAGVDGAATVSAFVIDAKTYGYKLSYIDTSYGYTSTYTVSLVDYDEDKIDMAKLVGSYYAADGTHFRLSDGGAGNVGVGYSYGSYSGKFTYFKWTGEKDADGNWKIMLTVDATYNGYYDYTGNVDTSYVNEEVAVTIANGVVTLTKADGTVLTFTKA